MMGTDSPFNSMAADYDRWFGEKDGKIIFATGVTAFQKVLPLLLKLWLVPAETAWGIAHLQEKQAAHPFYEHANLYTSPQLKSLLRDTGFAMSITISTLFQKTKHLTGIETPLTDFHEDAGFLVVVADKIPHPPGMW